MVVKMLTSNQNYHDKHKQFDAVTTVITPKLFNSVSNSIFTIIDNKIIIIGKAGLGTSQRVLLYSYLHVLSAHMLVF